MALAALPLIVTACSTAPPAPTEPARWATLEVINRGQAELDVSIRGRVEGTVPGQSRARFRRLVPGDVRLDVSEPLSGKRVTSDRLTLGASELDIWDPLGPNAGPMPAELGRTSVTNTSLRPAAVRIGDRPARTIAPGETLMFNDLAVGPHKGYAQTDDGRAVTATVTAAQGSSAPTWTLAFGGSQLTVFNDSAEAVILTIDGQARGVVEAGSSYVSPEERAGAHLVEATSRRSRRQYQTLIELGDAPAEWRISSGQASLLVVNRSGERVTLAVTNGDATGDPTSVRKGKRHVIDPLPVGVVSVSAQGESGAVYTTRVDLSSGQQATWTILPLEGTVRVDNHTDHRLALYLDRRPVGEVEAQSTGLIRRVPTRPFQLEAVDRTGRFRFTDKLDLSAAGSTTWTIVADTGAVTINNERPEPVEVYVDAVRLGDVASDSSLTFTGIATGPRLVEAVGGKSNQVLRNKVDVVERDAALVTLTNPTGWLTVVNKTDGPIRATGLLEGQLASLGVASTKRYLVPVGTRTILFVDLTTGTAHKREFTVEPGAELEWTIKARRGVVVVWNRLDEDLALTIDDDSAGVLGRGKSRALDDLSHGAHKLQAVGLKTERVFTNHIMIVGDEPLAWTLDTTPGRLVLNNATHERVSIDIDSRPYGMVEPESGRIFANVWPGTHVVTVTGTVSGKARDFKVNVDSAQDELLTVEPMMGVVVVDNRARQELLVRVDGDEIARIDAGVASTQLPVAAGSRFVQIERVGHGDPKGFQLDVQAGHAIHLPIDRPTVRLVVANRTASSLTIRRGDRPLGTIPAGASATYEGLAPGESVLSARREAGGAVTHLETRVLRAGDTATWLLNEAVAN